MNQKIINSTDILNQAETDTGHDNIIEIFNKIDFEKIKDHPNILIAANFWDEDRYSAARTCYKYMRAIDDLIDDHKAKFRMISENEMQQFITDVKNWINAIKENNSSDPLQRELAGTISRFLIPLWPLEAFAKAMIYDINHDGFPTIKSFLEYAEGASVAPASIFVHLCGINDRNGSYTRPLFDVREASLPCAVFSYLVHIIRDFQKDQNNNLNYFADDLISRFGLTREELKNVAAGGKMPAGFRALMNEYFILADEYRQKTYKMIRKIQPYLEPRYRLSLEIIFSLYLMVFERIDIRSGRFTAEELNPTPAEIRKKVFEVIQEFGN